MSSAVEIANMALAELSAEPIASFQEDSLSAREVRRFYSHSIGKLLERWDWSFANRRLPLALLMNDRASEWPYAYALPSDISTPIRVVPIGAAGYAYGWAGSQADIPFIIEGRVLYTGLADAILEYGAAGLSEDTFPVLFTDAVIYELASRLCMPIKKSREGKSDLMQLAEVARERAQADDANRQPTQRTYYIGEVERARVGLIGPDPAGWSPGWTPYRSETGF